jgi:hypothetical protein
MELKRIIFKKIISIDTICTEFKQNDRLRRAYVIVLHREINKLDKTIYHPVENYLMLKELSDNNKIHKFCYELYKSSNERLPESTTFNTHNSIISNHLCWFYKINDAFIFKDLNNDFLLKEIENLYNSRKPLIFKV